MRIRIIKKMLVARFCLGIVLLAAACSSDSSNREPEEIILAKIGRSTISLAEFMRRSEMTIRPPYCNSSNNLHKKIVLNSLIAEKMLAMEAGDDNEFVQNEEFQNYLIGREEQAMREWLLNTEGFQKVQLDKVEIERVYNLAGRTYNLKYFDIPSDSVAAIIDKEIRVNGTAFEVAHERLWQGEEIAHREVSWKSQEHPVIHEALFSDSLDTNEVIGPLRISEDNHIVIKVVGWKDELAISDGEIRERWSAVEEKLTKKAVDAIYDEFVVKVMEGKRLEFNRQTLQQIVSLIGPQYVRFPKDKRDSFLRSTFNIDVERPELDGYYGIEALLDNSLLVIDGNVWSVRDFRTEIQKHPLVFRRPVGTEEDFAEQFKLAIVDMVRDRYLTNEAYKRGYNEINVVKRNKQMWKDALIAQYQKYEYLKTSVSNPPDSVNTLALVTDYLEPYVNELQEKYSDIIEVNVEALDELTLTRIDMVVMQEKVPFPLIVPAFPQLTTDIRLDYGRRMEH
ncbi:hypothetical protein ACFL45_05985 [Candidatus Neomarinimicrobiota bacterium]